MPGGDWRAERLICVKADPPDPPPPKTLQTLQFKLFAKGRTLEILQSAVPFKIGLWRRVATNDGLRSFSLYINIHICTKLHYIFHALDSYCPLTTAAPADTHCEVVASSQQTCCNMFPRGAAIIRPGGKPTPGLHYT